MQMVAVGSSLLVRDPSDIWPAIRRQPDAQVRQSAIHRIAFLQSVGADQHHLLTLGFG